MAGLFHGQRHHDHQGRSCFHADGYSGAGGKTLTALRNLLSGLVARVPWLRRQKIRRLRRLIRAALHLARSNEPFRHHEFVNEMCRQTLSLPNTAFLGIVPNRFEDQASLAVRQALRQYQVYTNWLPQISLHIDRPKDPIALAVPPAWRRNLAKKGVLFSGYRARAAWLYFLTQSFLRGIRAIALLSREMLFGQLPQRPHALVVNLDHSGVPGLAAPNEARYDYITWLHRTFPDFTRNVQVLACVSGTKMSETGSSVTLVRHPMPRLASWGAKLGFSVAALQITLIVAVRFLTGAWWAPVLFREAVLLAYMGRVTDDHLARFYFFNGWIPLRPLWTYEAEQRGSRIISVAASTNFEFWSFDPAQPMPNHALQEGSNWPEVRVLDNYGAKAMLARGVSADSISVAGDMDVADNDEPTRNIPKNAIIVFDVPPFRIASRAAIGDFHYYYDLRTAVKFLRDIVEIAAVRKQPVLIKRKRAASVVHISAYERELERISAFPGVHLVDPGIAARRLADRATMALSLPFTSAGIVVAEAGKPSAFYDPLGRLGNHDRFAHGLPVLAGRAALEEWIEEYSRPDQTAENDGVEAPRYSRQAEGM